MGGRSVDQAGLTLADLDLVSVSYCRRKRGGPARAVSLSSRGCPRAEEGAPVRLEARIAIVTGGASGLGRAIALGYAAEGAALVIVDRHYDSAEAVAEQIRATGRQALALAADVARAAEVEQAVARALETFGRIDVLVNSAGISTNAPFLEATQDDFERVIQTDLKGTFFFGQAVARRMVEQGAGSIVNLASQSGTAYVQGLSAEYHAAKAAVIHLTRVMAVELGPRGVRVNAIAPALMLTPLTQPRWDSQPAMREYHLGKLPLQRVGEPGDIVGPAIFLASADSAYVTGHTLFVDGGFTAE
jgi:NAD(P)-dependent dehydrogenase (short-subunit alcohol dehydrogenase family)